MPSPRTPHDLELEDGSGAQPRHDQAPAEPSRINPVTRIQTLTGGYIARHPALLRVLEWLGWNNPGGDMKPEGLRAWWLGRGVSPAHPGPSPPPPPGNRARWRT